MKETTEELKDEGTENVQEIGFEEAARLDMLDSKFFKPETNEKYMFTFNSWRLVRKEMPDFNDKTKKVTKTVLELGIETLNGIAPTNEMTWDITSKKCREAFEALCKYPEDAPKEGKNILKKKILYIHKGEGKQRTYSVSDIGEKTQA